MFFISNTTFTICIPGDSEGYVTFECPFCGSKFKLQAGEYQSEDAPVTELFCPYCGLTRKDDAFLSQDVIEYARALAENYFIEQLNEAFGKASQSINRSGRGVVKMEYKPLKKVETPELRAIDSSETEFKCSCCERRVKVLYCAGSSKIFCPYCGVDM